MPEIFEEQIVIIGKDEPVFCEFRDDVGNLVDPTNPKIYIFSPSKTTVINNATMLKQSTGVYYYIFTPTAGAVQGYYQAWFFGEVGGLLRSNDYPKPLYVRQLPWNWGLPNEFLRSVRRTIGDNDPSHYHIDDKQLIYYIKEAVEECEAKIPMGYTVDASPDGVIFNKDLTSRAATLFRYYTAYKILLSVINSHMYDVGIIDAGDIKINKSGHLASKIAHLKSQEKKIEDFINNILLTDNIGIEVITFGDGIITGWWD